MDTLETKHAPQVVRMSNITSPSGWKANYQTIIFAPRSCNDPFSNIHRYGKQPLKQRTVQEGNAKVWSSLLPNLQWVWAAAIGHHHSEEKLCLPVQSSHDPNTKSENFYLVVSTNLNNIRHNGHLPQVVNNENKISLKPPHRFWLPIQQIAFIADLWDLWM